MDLLGHVDSGPEQACILTPPTADSPEAHLARRQKPKYSHQKPQIQSEPTSLAWGRGEKRNPGRNWREDRVLPLPSHVPASSMPALPALSQKYTSKSHTHYINANNTVTVWGTMSRREQDGEKQHSHQAKHSKGMKRRE